MAHGPDLSLSIARLTFGGEVLYKDFHLNVAGGEIVALIGPSGVGKTTLLRILAGVETGFDGLALVDGHPAPLAPVPGLVFQDARLLPWLSCADNLRAVRPDVSDEVVAQALAATGLVDVQDKWPRQLSGGMQRRLGLARALLVNPRLMLLDEPFVSLDRVVVRELQALVTDLIVQSGATAVLVSHDPQDAARLAHRVVIIAGRPVQIAADLALDALPAQRSRTQIIAYEDRIETAMVESAL